MNALTSPGVMSGSMISQTHLVVGCTIGAAFFVSVLYEIHGPAEPSGHGKTDRNDVNKY